MFITETTKNWEMELTAGGKRLLEVNPERYVPERWAITITIYNSDDAIQLHTLNMHMGLHIY